MPETIGSRIAAYRKEKGYTQEEIAQQLGVSSQAVSKWENDTSCPDIALLVPLSQLLGTTVDAILSGKPQGVTILPPSQRRSIDDMTLRILVETVDQGKKTNVKVNVPMKLVRLAIEMGMQLPQVTSNAALQSLDLEAIFRMVESGVIGKLLDVEVDDVTKVAVLVEENAGIDSKKRHRAEQDFFAGDAAVVDAGA